MRNIFALLVSLTLVFSVHAQEREFTEYEYDEVGNTIAITSEVSGATPSILSFSPEIVRQNQVLQIVINGEGLRGPQIESDNNGFSFSNVQSTNEQLSFTLTVDGGSQIGSSQILITTGLGSDSINLNVLSEIPDLRIAPSPVVLALDSTQELLVSLSTLDVLDHAIAISVSDPSVLSLSTNNVVITSGDLKPAQAVNLTALQNGTSRITFESNSLGTFSYTARVTDETFELNVENGQSVNFISGTVGLNKLFTPPPPDIVPVGPITNQINIIRQFTPTVGSQQSLAFSNSIGLLKGAFFSAVTPNVIGEGTNNNQITLSGVGLADVDDIQVLPNDNVTLGAFTPSADGQTINLSIDVAEGTAFSARQLILNANGNVIPVTAPNADRIWIGGAVPVINSVTPFVFNRNRVATITVRGQGLESVTAVRDIDGTILSRPTIADDGLSLTFQLQVEQFALIGSRDLILESSLGDSGNLNSDSASIFIQDQPVSVLSDVTGSVVGINKLVNGQGSNDQEAEFASPIVGIVSGTALTGLSPETIPQDSEAIINLSGANLSSVVSAEFVPAEGITVGEFTPSQDGLTATLQVSVGNDADPSVRTLLLSNGAEFIASVTGQDRLEVIRMRPIIGSVNPLQIEQGASSVAFTVRGQLLNDVTSISVIPPAGISIDTLNISADGSEIQTIINIAEGADLGSRVIQLNAPSGSTESTSLITNTIQIVSEIDDIFTPVVSSVVGLIKQNTGPGGELPETSQRSFVSNRVGLVKEFTQTPVDRTEFITSQHVGISKGPIVQSISPTRLVAGISSQTIEVNGVNLDNVTTVRTIPADGITLNGPAIIANDGSRVTFTADVEADAEQTIRRVELVTDSGLVQSINLSNASVQVVGLSPQIDSIEPIQEARGASFMMTIRGINLRAVESIQATPANGISFGDPVVATDERSLTVQVVINPDATSEQKLIQVITAAGTSIDVLMPENTFTIISE